ncbi:MAG: glycine cleavage system protein GcvH [Saprospiraceae bacterium]
MNVPANLKYSEDHEWIRVEEGNIAYIGITNHAQSELGEIVYVEVEMVDEELNAGDVFGTVEAVKTTSDLYMPVSGKILEFNSALDSDEGDNPGLVNESPYKDGWIIKIEMSDVKELEKLLDAVAYTELIEG